MSRLVAKTVRPRTDPNAAPMETPADFRIASSDGGSLATLTGDWTTSGLGDAGHRLTSALAQGTGLRLDMTKVRRMDTAGAYAVIRAGFKVDDIHGRPETLRLMHLVSDAVATEPVKVKSRTGFHELTIRLGKGVFSVGTEFLDTMAFLGQLLVTLAQTLVKLFTAPHKIRWPAIVAQMERAGLDAIPIVAVTTFFIGAVVGLLGANMLRQFGAEVFAVELIGIAVFREFNIIITAVLLAGRSASSFAAELGSMKMNQEIDAMKVMGVDPFEALVMPRFMALLLIIPLLTFVATLAGLLGGMLVVWMALDLGPSFFLQRILDNVGAQQLWIGLSKAPVMAAVIAGIGCRQGLEVGGDVESLGRRVTASVVHAIFAIIAIDAVFALLYMQLNI